MNESAAYRAEAAEKAVWKAVWKCIVDASSMNVVLSGPEYKAAMRDYRVAVEAAERARILAAVEALPERFLDDDGDGYGGVSFVHRAAVPAIIKGEPT